MGVVLGSVIKVPGRDPCPWRGLSGTHGSSWDLKVKSQLGRRRRGWNAERTSWKNIRSKRACSIGSTGRCRSGQGGRRTTRVKSGETGTEQSQLWELRLVRASCALISSLPNKHNSNHAAWWLEPSDLTDAGVFHHPHPKVPVAERKLYWSVQSLTPGASVN